MVLLWLALAFLTALVLAGLGRSLARDAAAPSATEAELAVYRDQMREIEADRDRGLIAGAEAEAARVEIARRLLAVDARHAAAGSEQAGDARPGKSRLSPTVLAVAIALPALGLYLALGSPNLPGRPHAGESKAADRGNIDKLVAQVEERLRTKPDDGQGWDVIAPVYLRLQRFPDAAEAYGNAARLLGESPQRLAGFAEATIMANDGVVVEVARRSLERVLVLDGKRLEPRFWLALAKEQDGDFAGAATDYRALLALATDGVRPPAWRTGIEERLRQVESQAGVKSGAPPATGPAGPTAADAEAASRMAPEDRQKMIAGMVDGLAARLEKDGRNPEGWARLIQSYMVLGRRDDALAAAVKARAALAGDDKALETLAQVIKQLGLDS